MNNNFPKYLSLCAIIKNEAPYLVEWIEYHRMMGVELFYLYDNNSTDNTQEILAPYIKNNIVRYKPWHSYQPGQMPAYNDCLQNNKEESFWIGFVDLDEFIVPVKNNSIPELLKDFEEYGGLGINWILYGSSGHKTKPEGLIIENYTYRSNDDFDPNRHIKSIVNPRKVKSCANPHFFIYTDSNYAVTENKEKIDGPFSAKNSMGKIRINHYFTRSKDEFIKKIERGRADNEKKRPLTEFEEYDRNEVYDSIMVTHVEKLKEIIKQSGSVKKINGKILFVSHEASRTGAPLLLLRTLDWIKNNTNIEFEILLKRGGELVEDFQKMGQTILLAGMPQEELLRHLERYKQENIKLIYSNTVTNGHVQAFLGQLKVPQICHVRELENIIFSCGEENFNLVNNFSTTIIADSEAVKKNLVQKRKVSAEKVKVIPEFIELPNFDNFNEDLKKKIKAELNIPENSFIVGGSGMMQWRKGVDTFIFLSKLINKKLGNIVHFVWLGGISNKLEYQNYLYDIEKAGLKDVFHFLNQRSNPLDYIYAYDVFVMSSREEPFGVVNLEAAVFEKPVLCFEDSGGAPEFVENDAGFIIPYLDIEEMAQKTVYLLLNPELRNKMGKIGSNKVKQKHDINILIPQILQICTQVIN